MTTVESGFGWISEFDEKLEDWIQYSEQLPYFFGADKIDDSDQRKAILHTIIEPMAYKLLRSLVAP